MDGENGKMKKIIVKNCSPIMVILLVFSVFVLTGCVSEDSQDSDGDGISDQAEENGWQITVYNIDGSSESKRVYSNPNKVDTDDDGLNDYEEMMALTNPSNPDTDGDGIDDGDEKEYGTSPVHFDSWVIDVKGESKRVFANYSKQGNIATQFDSDFDGLNDFEEYEKGSNPSKKDTDGDGDDDYLDPAPGWNLQVDLIINSFTLKKNKDTVGGADLYFVVQIGDEELNTDVWDVSLNEEKQINTEYVVDFSDKSAFESDTVSIQLVAFDEDASLLGDQTIEINEGNEDYSVQYNISDLEQNDYALVGDEGDVSFSLQMKRT